MQAHSLTRPRIASPLDIGSSGRLSQELCLLYSYLRPETIGLGRLGDCKEGC